MTIIYIVEGEHFSVPGTNMRAFTSEDAATRYAAELCNIILANIGRPAVATWENWQDSLPESAVGCNVWLTPLELGP